MRKYHSGLVLFAVLPLMWVTPAATAADKTVHVYLPGHADEEWAGRGSWRDENNTLCALLGQNESHDKLVVRIRPVNGDGPTFKLIDPDPLPSAHGVCSEQLPLRENRRYRMRVTVKLLDGDRYSVSSTFRT